MRGVANRANKERDKMDSEYMFEEDQKVGEEPDILTSLVL